VSEALSDMLPLAVAIAASPVPVVAVVLMLMSAGGRVNALALVAGWAAALAVVAGVVAVLGLGSGPDGGGRGVAVAQLAIAGILLVVIAVEWRDRPRAGAPRRAPRWMRALGDLGPARAGALGVGLIVFNAKDGALTVAAGSKLAGAAPATPAALVCVAVFVVVASATLVAPLAVELGLGDRAAPILARWHASLERHGSMATIVTVGVVAAVLAAQGLHGL
jgi:lysylphosphatidylglycerol synthetase-like protein (DUF2156 family)